MQKKPLRIDIIPKFEIVKIGDATPKLKHKPKA